MMMGLQLSGPVERQAIFTPLGIRFWDPALDRQISDGLTITATPMDERGKVTLAQRTASGIYAFYGLPGLRNIEYPSDVTNFESSPPFTRRFIVRVVDNHHRFLDTVFGVNLPYFGIYPTDPSNSLPGFYLFSAPTRPSIPNLAVVRAQIIEKSDSATNKPAAYAALEIEDPNNRVWYGIADEYGSLAVHFPYPTFTSPPPSSPPVAEGNQQWEITIRIRYAPEKLTILPGSSIPDLYSILDQPQGMIWPTTSASVESLSATLNFGEELILRTDAQSELWVQSG